MAQKMKKIENHKSKFFCKKNTWKPNPSKIFKVIESNEGNLVDPLANHALEKEDYLVDIFQKREKKPIV